MLRQGEKTYQCKMKSLVVYLLLFFVITSLTSGYVLRRSGCPSVPVNNRCSSPRRNLCSYDVDCSGGSRCCSNGCNLMCVNNLAGLGSVFSLFYDPFSYAAFGPFRNSFWG